MTYEYFSSKKDLMFLYKTKGLYKEAADKNIHWFIGQELAEVIEILYLIKEATYTISTSDTQFQRVYKKNLQDKKPPLLDKNSHMSHVPRK